MLVGFTIALGSLWLGRIFVTCRRLVCDIPFTINGFGIFKEKEKEENCNESRNGAETLYSDTKDDANYFNYPT
jgi:hypothetical protein